MVVGRWRVAAVGLVYGGEDRWRGVMRKEMTETIGILKFYGKGFCVEGMKWILSGRVFRDGVERR